MESIDLIEALNLTNTNKSRIDEVFCLGRRAGPSDQAEPGAARSN